jgi:antitoxin (DNA-binding transcriptional repressor) of toxin-antitoxin stability system
MSTISVQDIQRGVLAFLRRVEAGESFLVVSGAHPVAEVRPVAAPATELRPIGLRALSQVVIVPALDPGYRSRIAGVHGGRKGEINNYIHMIVCGNSFHSLFDACAANPEEPGIRTHREKNESPSERSPIALSLSEAGNIQRLRGMTGHRRSRPRPCDRRENIPAKWA